MFSDTAILDAADLDLGAEDTGAEMADPGEVYFAQARTLADALVPKPARLSVVRGIIQPASLSLWYSNPGSLKSNLLMDLCVCVAAGLPWLSPPPGTNSTSGIAVNQCPTLWLDMDNGIDVTEERLAAFARAYGLSDAPYYTLSFPSPAILAARGLAPLTAYARRINAGFIVIDTLLRVAGVRDENSSEMDVAMTNLRRLTEETGAAVNVIHHRRKDTQGREGDSVRGHSSIEGSIDTAFLVKRDEDEVTVKCTKSRRKPVEPFAARWTYEHAEDGETLQQARFYRATIVDPKAEASAEVRRKIAEALMDNAWLSQRGIADTAGIRRATVTEELAKMRTERLVTCKDGPKNAILYRLAE